MPCGRQENELLHLYLFFPVSGRRIGDEMIQTQHDASSRTSIHFFFSVFFLSDLIIAITKVVPAHFPGNCQISGNQY